MAFERGLKVNTNFKKLIKGLHCSHSRFKMLRLSSSSTAGLWLSLLRKNTKITFWTIFSLRRCWTFFPLFSLFNSKTLSSLQPAQKCAYPAAERPELRSKTRIIWVLQHLRLHIGEKKPGRAYKSRFGGKKESERLKQEKQVRREAQRWWWWALPLRAERAHFTHALNEGRAWGGDSPRTHERTGN